LPLSARHAGVGYSKQKETLNQRRASAVDLPNKIIFMSKIVSREIRLAFRPNGMPTADNFTLAQTELEPLRDQEVLVRNLFMSVDPYMRGRMKDRKSYVPPFELGKALEGGAIGEVIESRAKEFKPGDVVTSNFGWREYFVASPKELHPVSREVQPLSVYLGALGMTGMTAWAGLNLVEVKAGDVIYISGAAGAVGSVAGQLAKLRGVVSSDQPARRKRWSFCVKNAALMSPSTTRSVLSWNN